VQRQNDQNHFKVTLMNADAQEIGPFASGKNNGTAGNTFPGTSNNRLFNTKTMPNSMSFAHMDTFVSVSNISDPGPTMKMDVSVR
jgi:immune inhibitor A